jgi:hypothetical protein
MRRWQSLRPHQLVTRAAYSSAPSFLGEAARVHDVELALSASTRRTGCLAGGVVVLADVSGGAYRSMSVRASANDLAGVSAAVPLQSGGLDPILQHPTQLERKRRAPAPTTILRKRLGCEAAAKSEADLPMLGPTTCGSSSPNASAIRAKGASWSDAPVKEKEEPRVE